MELSFCNALESHRIESHGCHFSTFNGSFLYQRAKPQGTVLLINLLGKGLTSRACTEDGGSI